jgi:hypothetical protein
MTIKEVRKAIDQLPVTTGELIVVGSSILEILGIRKSHDLDMMVREATFQHITSAGYSATHYADGTGKIELDNAEIMHNWLGKTYDDLITDIVRINDVQFLSLRSLRALKLEQGRPKDLRDIALIDSYLATHKLV